MSETGVHTCLRYKIFCSKHEQFVESNVTPKSRSVASANGLKLAWRTVPHHGHQPHGWKRESSTAPPMKRSLRSWQGLFSVSTETGLIADDSVAPMSDPWLCRNALVEVIQKVAIEKSLVSCCVALSKVPLS